MTNQSSALANRVTLFILLGAIAFYAVIGASLDSIRRQSNESAKSDTARFVSERVEVLRNQVRQYTRDYNNWSDVYFAAQKGNITFLADNYGITAINGDMFDGAILYDGPFKEPIAWKSGGERAPGDSFLTDTDLESIKMNVNLLGKVDRPTFDFVKLIDGYPVFASASRILPDTADDLLNLDHKTAPIGIIFRTPHKDELDAISSSLALRDFAMDPTSEAQFESFPLPGANGRPEVYVSWLAPLPGDRMIAKILPVLAFILTISIVVIATGTRFLRMSAVELEVRESQALDLARSDALTGLPNRLALAECLSRLESDSAENLAIILLDLDGFKNVNDLVGHAGGDHVICEVARRFKRFAGDGIFCARIGGDEFVVVIHGPADLRERAKFAAEALLDLTSEPIFYQGSRFDVSCSIGAALRISCEQPLQDLLQCADRAMYQSKKLPGSTLTFYDSQMDEASELDRATERSLRSALRDPHEFSVLYQPIVDPRSGLLVRVEALARWTSPKLGVVGPDVFIPVAEKSGIICALGDLFMEKVAADMFRYDRIKVSINVSPLQLMAPGFVERLLSVFERLGIDSTRVEIELTEGIAIQNLDGVSGQLHDLKSKGFTTALDDFGTGFSSLGYLRNMPFDTLKIDRSFVSDSDIHASISEFVKPIISLGHALGKKVTAEGVESEQVARLLSIAGCDSLQGYFYGKPQSIDSILRKFSNSKDLVSQL